MMMMMILAGDGAGSALARVLVCCPSVTDNNPREVPQLKHSLHLQATQEELTAVKSTATQLCKDAGARGFRNSLLRSFALVVRSFAVKLLCALSSCACGSTRCPAALVRCQPPCPRQCPGCSHRVRESKPV
eukprot:268583-Rhodomonas_salina.1